MELVETTDVIAADDLARALEFQDKLVERAEGIGLTPYGYPERPELGRGLRVCPHQAYNIYYTVDDEGVRIERIIHSARAPGPPLNS